MTPQNVRMTPDFARKELERIGELGKSSGPISIASAAFRTIAGMRWEYAVRIDFETGARLYVRPGITTRYADCALWRAKLEEAQKIADKARTLYTEPVHIVRRMVSEAEVTE